MSLTKVNPMLCEPCAEPFDSDDFMFEPKFDGDRAILFVGASVSIFNRRGVDMTYRYPELQKIANGKKGILDGEIVVFENGISNFDLLAQRSHLQKAFDIELRMKKIPVTFVAFDLLELEGQVLIDKPLHERKALLQQFRPIPGLFEWGLPMDKEGKGTALWQIVKAKGMEGLVAKHIDSTYQQGKRSPSWKKIKNVKTVDMWFVKYEENPAGIKLYAGDGDKWPDGKATTVQCSGSQSRLVKHLMDSHGGALVEVKYLNLTPQGRLRQPTFKGLKNGGFIQ